MTRHGRKKLARQARLLQREVDPNAPGHQSAALAASAGNDLHFAAMSMETKRLRSSWPEGQR